MNIMMIAGISIIVVAGTSIYIGAMIVFGDKIDNVTDKFFTKIGDKIAYLLEYRKDINYIIKSLKELGFEFDDKEVKNYLKNNIVLVLNVIIERRANENSPYSLKTMNELIDTLRKNDLIKHKISKVFFQSTDLINNNYDRIDEINDEIYKNEAFIELLDEEYFLLNIELEDNTKINDLSKINKMLNLSKQKYDKLENLIFLSKEKEDLLNDNNNIKNINDIDEENDESLNSVLTNNKNINKDLEENTEYYNKIIIRKNDTENRINKLKDLSESIEKSIELEALKNMSNTNNINELMQKYDKKLEKKLETKKTN